MLGNIFQWILKILSRRKLSDGSDTLLDSSQSQQNSLDSPPLKEEQTKKGKISKWFTYDEATRSSTASQRGIDNTPRGEYLDNIKDAAKRLDEVRELLGCPIIVSSWYRCPELNRAVGGSATSDHMTGKSIDFVSPKFGSVRAVCEKIANSDIKFDQLIYETNSRGSQWVHIGFGDRMRRQVLTYNPKKGYRYVGGIHD